MGPMPQPAENVFAQRMGVNAIPPSPTMQNPNQPVWGANPPRNIFAGAAGPPATGVPAYPVGGMPERPIGMPTPVQGIPAYPVGAPPVNGTPAYPAPGIMQNPDVQNFLRRRLMGADAPMQGQPAYPVGAQY